MSYELSGSAVTVNLAAGTGSAGEAAGDIFEDTPERLVGSAQGDSLTGSSLGDTIEAGSGNDTLFGGAGNDTLFGGDGNDTIDAGAGDDLIVGGAGNDILIGGNDSDTYLIEVNSGADEIRNFDPNGTDVDVVGYCEITNNRLWFESSGNDLIVTVVGAGVQTTVKDWYLVASANDRENYKIDFFIAGDRVSSFIDADMLVALMASATPSPPPRRVRCAPRHTGVRGSVAHGLEAESAAERPRHRNPDANEDGTLTLTGSHHRRFHSGGRCAGQRQAVRRTTTTWRI